MSFDYGISHVSPQLIANHCIHIVTSMESRFSAMRVLWLGREFYKVKHGVTSATLMARMTLATNLATILAIWRQIDDSRKCNPFLDISTRKGNTRENTMWRHDLSERIFKDGA
ncbi:hypothetical protein AVEN_180867-1 [Araneus ventricosus]|uniref:Uncharacterized protein n=1 Tax=Araneus ventricosus TaxID=182803 RepID=A0A4Y2QNE5_ARAVE|nr:hypothetical protein AVEN_180867-1 [Araneus ventricosus]